MFQLSHCCWVGSNQVIISENNLYSSLLLDMLWEELLTSCMSRNTKQMHVHIMWRQMYSLKYHLLLTSPKSSFTASYFRSKVPYIILMDSLGPPSTFKISCGFIGIRYHKIIMKYLVLSPHLDHLFSVLLKKSGQNMIICQRVNFLKTYTKRQKAKSTCEQGFGDIFVWNGYILF